jgi:succinate dehydrogenase/fumarate reductase flavoprotein subunit
MATTEQVDMLVIGGGMAGLTAGASAAQKGARVILVEKGPNLGGTALWAGFLWTARSLEAFRENVPDGDASLGEILVNGRDAAVEWVRSLGVNVAPAISMMKFGRGNQIDLPAYLRACERLIRDSGGTIHTTAHTERLLADGGRVIGAEVRLSTGERLEIPARWTLLATGGFQNDRELTAKYIHPNAAEIPRRTNPYSSGDGLRLGLSVGAAAGRRGAGFYGHLVPYPVNNFEPSNFVDLSLYYSEHGLLINRQGRRFVDETLGDHLSTQALLEQPDGRALLLSDERVRRDWIGTSYVEGVAAVDKLGLARKHGARCVTFDSIDELAYLPDEWGYDGEAVLETVKRFNVAASKNPTRLDPPRALDAAPIDEPPFFVVECQAAITFTQYGMLIDSQARVLRESGPIPGLLAAGGDSGGAFVYAYAGGIALAAVFGLRAAETALAGVVSAAKGQQATADS